MAWMFSIFMDGAVSEGGESKGNEPRATYIQCRAATQWQVSQLMFADDTALVSDLREKLRSLVRTFWKVCERRRRRKLTVNATKKQDVEAR